MVAPPLLLFAFLLLLMWAGLLLAKWALNQQSDVYWRLRELASLAGRYKHLLDSARALQKIDADSEILGLLTQAASKDLDRMQSLDPNAQDMDRLRRELEAASRSPNGAGGHGSAAVASEQELLMVQRHIQDSLDLFTGMYKTGQISAGQFEGSREKLRTLGLRLAVNSSLLMAQRAVDQHDGVRAMACFRRAESLLSMRGLTAAERQEKQAYILAERERLFADRGAGLLLLTGSK